MSSGTALSKEISNNIISLPGRGTQLAAKFMNERLKTQQVNFQETLPRTNIKLFKDNNKKHTVKKNNTTKTIETNRNILGTLLTSMFSII